MGHVPIGLEAHCFQRSLVENDLQIAWVNRAIAVKMDNGHQ